MTLQQIELFTIFTVVLGLLLWGRVRHDLVAAAGLLIAVAVGVVPDSRAFSGFSNPAVLIVAFVLVASRAFENSGALALVGKQLSKTERSMPGQIAISAGVGAALSAVINNVAALALLMPIDIQAARRAGRSPRLTLMPLAFATILGGMITLIGTPTNIIASSIRERELGAPYRMFDFAPVGLAVATAGLAFLAAVGWRLLPSRGREAAPPAREQEFTADLIVPEATAPVGKYLSELDHHAEEADILIVDVVRDGERLPGNGRFVRLAPGDVVAVEGSTEGIAAFIKALGLQQRELADDRDPDGPAEGSRADRTGGGKSANHHAIVEAVVRADARIGGRSAESFRLRSRFGVTLLGIAHQGRTIRDRVRARAIEPGDVLLLTGPHADLPHVLNWIGAMPIDEISIAPANAWRIATAIGCFAAAIIAASFGWLSFTTAMAAAVAVYAATGLVPLRELYSQVEWSVVVMLAFLLPLGEAFDGVGGTGMAADLIVRVTHGQPAVVALIALMIVTMILSGVLNNVATMVIVGPLAIAMAGKLGVNPDAFLIGVAVATSCAFLTPIGHKNNTLIMGPGGYAFADYLFMGLPLAVVVLIVSVPAILIFWPL